MGLKKLVVYRRNSLSICVFYFPSNVFPYFKRFFSFSGVVELEVVDDKGGKRGQMRSIHDGTVAMNHVCVLAMTHVCWCRITGGGGGGLVSTVDRFIPLFTFFTGPGRNRVLSANLMSLTSRPHNPPLNQNIERVFPSARMKLPELKYQLLFPL